MDPNRVTPKEIASIQEAGDYVWAGQYQQRPAPRDGALFDVEKMDVVEFCPEGGVTIAGWDLAGSKRKKSPYTVRVLMTKVGGDIYIRNVVRKRLNPTQVNQLIVDTSIEDRNLCPDVLISLPQDPGYGGKAVKWQISDLLVGFVYKVTPETGDKETRALPFASQVGAERVHMVKGDWNGAYREELRGFPTGTYKDQVDASSRAFMELVGTMPVAENAAPIPLDETEDDQPASRALQSAEVDPWGA